MSTHGERLLNGVRELVRIDGTTLEDLHVVITDLIATLDKQALQIAKKLKEGQEIRIYDEDSRKEYGAKGADLRCFLRSTREQKRAGLLLLVYTAKEEWEVSVDCLLDIYDSFDPESEEGKKLLKAPPRKRGRKPKKDFSESSDGFSDFENTETHTTESEYEQELDGEEYDFSNSDEWGDFYPNDEQ